MSFAALTLTLPERWQCSPGTGRISDPVEQNPKMAGKNEKWGCTLNPFVFIHIFASLFSRSLSESLILTSQEP